MAGVFHHDGVWLDEAPMILSPMDQAAWLSSIVFDGARAFGGLAPDLDQHCERLINSARALLLEPKIDSREIEALCVEGIRKMPRDSELYVRPMMYATGGFLVPDPETTTFSLAIYESPLPEFTGLSVCLSSLRRPARDMAPTDAKASCLYPNSSRALKEAEQRGFDNCIMLDPNGNVAELASANVWIVKDGRALTPFPNGTFLDGVTRGRVAQLLADDGVEVREETLTFADVMAADEVFLTGNYAKVMPITRVEDRDLQRGPVTQRARDLYWDYAETTSVF